MNGLRTILNNFGECLIKRNYIDPDAERNKTEAEIKALFLELIGEDETGGYARGVQPVRNKFRAELRKKVEEL